MQFPTLVRHAQIWPPWASNNSAAMARPIPISRGLWVEGFKKPAPSTSSVEDYARVGRKTNHPRHPLQWRTASQPVGGLNDQTTMASIA